MKRIKARVTFPIANALVSPFLLVLAASGVTAVAGVLIGFSVVASADDRQTGSNPFVSHEFGVGAYSVSASALEPEVRPLVSSGQRMINDLWVLPTDYNGVWGVGPTFNEASCPSCHLNNGRAKAPDDSGEVSHGLLLRLSIPGTTEHGAPRAHPGYGTQFQNRGAGDQVPAEGKAVINYQPVVVRFADGDELVLRKPVISFTKLAFGDLGTTTMVSARIAPSLIGLGLLEAVPEETVLAIARRQSEQGLNGTPNYVWDYESGKTVLGRFGWKASQPNLLQQTAAAFHADIGATSSFFRVENCPDIQIECIKGPTATGCSGGRAQPCTQHIYWEVMPSRLRNITRYVQALSVPAQRNADDPEVRLGERLFKALKCDGCHVPELKTGQHAQIAAASNLAIRPYTDLLLHDMGAELADDRPDFLANGRQWRTPPLWGLGLQKTVNGHTDMLHDGRARNFEEAIVWHGGEAQQSRDLFVKLDKRERAALIIFLESI